MELAGALALGVELRLLQKTPDGENYAIHRLVGEVRREEAPLAGHEAWIAEICQRIGDWFQERRNEYTKLLRFEAEIDHLRAWQRLALIYAPSHAPRLTWLHAYPPFQQGRYHEALSTVTQALDLLRKQNLADWEQEAHLLNDLASLQAALGNYREALEQQEEALSIRQKHHGNLHADTAMSLSNLAVLLNSLGNSKQALALETQALEIRRKLLGEQNAWVARSLSSIASCHHSLGKPELALKFEEQALAIRRQLFGERHPDSAASLSKCASIFNALGKTTPGLELAERALTIFRELFGERHPGVATELGNVAGYHFDSGKHELAMKLARQALTIRLELFDEHHPDVAASLGNIAIYTSHTAPTEALEMMKRALSILRTSKGKFQVDTLKTAGNLSYLLKEMGRRAEALAVLDEYLSGLSSDNPRYNKLRGQRQQLLATPIAKGFRQPAAHHGIQKKKKRR